MPKIPRNLSGRGLAHKLSAFGYKITRQTGSHIRLTASLSSGSHSATIPDHSEIKIGTLNNILLDISEHLAITKDTLIKEIF